MTLEALLKQIEKHIDDKTQHPYLDQYIDKPKIDPDKIKILISMFNINGSYSRISYCVTAIMIMQMALDMHDFIDNEPMPQADNRRRQLRVLAGDYYSSQYYCMLSEIEAFSMIRSLSEGIRKLNEEKVTLFRGNWDWEHFIGLMKQIESSLIAELADYLGLSHWVPFIGAYFTFKRILSEKQAITSGAGSVFIKPLFHDFPEKKQQFMQHCDEWLMQLKEEIETEIRADHPNGKVIEIIEPIWSGKDFSLSPNKLAEEGFK